ncbi:putative esterase YitV [Pullulanibacillus camelliae]|uniref:Putative esterase YitV n=1 Tax=Pullulanibacillus camelliae TaxID=1707096 RepID=A0A8J2YKF8_9BACL|nr:alpha/beta fold hydrolase [Pullulanibacillus camelliae]GGE51034.1 putative esterase YitV [Pullulanibacillus camelliae]
MQVIEELTSAGIPALHIVDKEYVDQPLPFIIFWHGWTSWKEAYLHYAYLAAKEGFRVILPDALGHGERLHELSEQERQYGFWQIVLQNIKDTELIKEDFEHKGLILDQRIAVAGVSMGAITTLGCLKAFDWIKVAVSLMGTPNYQGFADHLLTAFTKEGVALPYNDEQIKTMIAALAPYDLSQAPEKINQRPLLFWHGKLDPVVPYADSYQFYKQLKASGHPNVEYWLEDKAGHKVSRQGMLHYANWLKEHL